MRVLKFFQKIQTKKKSKKYLRTIGICGIIGSLTVSSSCARAFSYNFTVLETMTEEQADGAALQIIEKFLAPNNPIKILILIYRKVGQKIKLKMKTAKSLYTITCNIINLIMASKVYIEKEKTFIIKYLRFYKIAAGFYLIQGAVSGVWWCCLVTGGTIGYWTGKMLGLH